jgi:hypothetical protein
MDECDRADGQIEQAMTILLSRRKPELGFVGHCHYCEEPVQEPRRFCSKECGEDWELMFKMKGLNRG